MGPEGVWYRLLGGAGNVTSPYDDCVAREQCSMEGIAFSLAVRVDDVVFSPSIDAFVCGVSDCNGRLSRVSE